MEVAHDSIFGGHLEIKKTKNFIKTNFYWPGMQGDVTSFCRSCYVCQETIAKASVPHVPLGEHKDLSVNDVEMMELANCH